MEGMMFPKKKKKEGTKFEGKRLFIWEGGGGGG